MEEKTSITDYLVTESFKDNINLRDFLSNIIISKLLDKKSFLSDIYDVSREVINNEK